MHCHTSTAPICSHCMTCSLPVSYSRMRSSVRRRFKDCELLVVKCRHCKARVPFCGVFGQEDTEQKEREMVEKEQREKQERSTVKQEKGKDGEEDQGKQKKEDAISSKKQEEMRAKLRQAQRGVCGLVCPTPKCQGLAQSGKSSDRLTFISSS